MVINPPPEDDAETDINLMSKLVGVHMNMDVKSLHKCEPFSMFQVVRMNSALIHLWHNYYV